MFKQDIGFKNRGVFYHPFFAPILAIILAIFPLINCLCFEYNQAVYNTQLIDFKLTIWLYYATIVIVFLARPKDNNFKQNCIFILFEIIIIGALLREMGIQHWFTPDGSAAFKIKFFLLPYYSLTSKILAGSFILFWIFVLIFLIVRYAKFCWKGFWKGNTVVWTILTTCGITVFAKFMDRLEDNYQRFTGEEMSPFWSVFVGSFEEIYEAYIPIFLVIAAIQFLRLRIRVDD